MVTKIILNVPYSDKDQVKQLGAKWDPRQKTWYIPRGIDSKPFNCWLPKMSPKPSLIIDNISLLRNIIPCWSCKGYCTVFALATRQLTVVAMNEDKTKKTTKKSKQAKENNKISTKNQNNIIEIDYQAKLNHEQLGFFVLYEISDIAEELAEFISPRCANFRLGKASSHGIKYYRNHCEHCAMGFSDARLHKKNACFNPSKATDLKAMQCIELQFFDHINIKADYIDYSENKYYNDSLQVTDYLVDYL